MSILKIGQYTNLEARKRVLAQTSFSNLHLMMSAFLNLRPSVMATAR